MSETRKYRQFTPDEKAEIGLAGLHSDRAVRDVCREYEIAETLYHHHQWRERLLGGGKAALANRGRRPPSTPRSPSCAGRSASWSGRWVEDYELEVAGELSRDWT